MDTNLVYAHGAEALTNSILVAKKFEKDHQHILRDIRNLVEGVSKIGDTPMFEETTYIHPQNGQEYPMFIMNRDGFTLLAMGFFVLYIMILLCDPFPGGYSVIGELIFNIFNFIKFIGLWCVECS